MLDIISWGEDIEPKSPVVIGDRVRVMKNDTILTVATMEENVRGITMVGFHELETKVSVRKINTSLRERRIVIEPKFSLRHKFL